jgi:hypothetical protein
MSEIDQIKSTKQLQLRAAKTFLDISQTADDLMQSDNVDFPSARELSTKSGYSIGTLYRYFGSLNALFSFIFIDRHLRKVVIEAEELIGSFTPTDTITTVVTSIVNSLFLRLNKKKHTHQKYKFLVRILFKMAKKPEELNQVMDPVIPRILELQRNNVTGTIKLMNEDECRLALRGFQAIMRSPFMEGDPLAGSEEHKKYACEFGIALFGKVK